MQHLVVSGFQSEADDLPYLEEDEIEVTVQHHTQKRSKIELIRTRIILNKKCNNDIIMK